jgi:hypothetical protein
MRDYMIRQTQSAAARSEMPCTVCGHANFEHHELSRTTLTIKDGALATVPNPNHRALHFHCDHENCSCVMALS